MPMPIPGPGRNPRFKSVEEFKTEVDAYFDMCDSLVETFTDSKGTVKKIQKPYTVSGLAVYLNISKVILNDYSHKDGYKEVFAIAKSRIENYCEENTMTGKLNPVFSIFSLKNNFNWIDQVQTVNVQEPEKLTAEDIKKRLHDGKKED